MSHYTFRELERILGITYERPEVESSLVLWYEAVREKPLAEFTVGDLCRACRQELYLDYVVPVAIARLRENPLAGEMYEGELLAAISRIPPSWWAEHSELSRELYPVLKNVRTAGDAELAEDVQRLVKNISPRKRGL